MSSKLGPVISVGNSKLFQGPLGVVKVGFDGYDLGKTTADSALTFEEDIMDIIYQQDGTKAADHVRTGNDLLLSVTLGEIDTGLLARVFQDQIKTTEVGELSDSGVLTRALYTSLRDTMAKTLRIAAVNAEGEASEEDEDVLTFYEAIPILNGDLLNWGAGTQRNLPIQFRIKWHKFALGESTTYTGAFGYYGDPTVEDVPVAAYPDKYGPALVSAVATLATSMTITFNEDVEFVGGSYGNGIAAKVNNNKYVVATGASIVDEVVTATFAAASFAAGDVIELYISAHEMQDTDTVPNEYGGCEEFTCSNTIV